MIVPDKLHFQYCYDGVHFPKLFEPVVCLMRVRQEDKILTIYTVCTAVHSVDDPTDVFWIRHNSLSKERVHPYAYLVTPADANGEFLENINKFKTLTYNLKTPY